MLRTYDLEQVYQGRLETDSDLLNELTKIVEQQEITAGKVSAIGAVKEAVISYYDQQAQEYGEQMLNESLEIVSLTGNISLKDGSPIVHAHIALANEEGQVYGGHLEEGTTIFACEYVIEEYSGQAWEREFDSPTGLPLWQQDK